MPEQSRPDASLRLQRDIVRALGHPLRLRLLEAILERGEHSPVGLARELDQPLSTVSRHMPILRDLGFVELVRTEPRRGTFERIYKAVQLAFILDEEWEQLPLAMRRALARQTFRKLFFHASAAGARGGFDDAHAHLDFVPLVLDEIARVEVSKLLHECLGSLYDIQRRSGEREPGTGGGQPSAWTVGILHYRSSDAAA